MKMGNSSQRKIELLQSIKKVNDAIDEEVDWFLIHMYEKDKEKKEIYRLIYLSKKKKLSKIAKEMAEKYGPNN